MDVRVGTIKKADSRRIDAFESPLDCKEIKPVNPKGNQSWILIGRTDAEAEAPILWPSNVKSWLIGKDPDARKNWRQDGLKRGWDGWMASQTLWTWVWVNSGSWWWTERPGVLQSMGSQRVGHDWGELEGRPQTPLPNNMALSPWEWGRWHLALSLSLCGCWEGLVLLTPLPRSWVMVMTPQGHFWTRVGVNFWPGVQTWVIWSMIWPRPLPKLPRMPSRLLKKFLFFIFFKI